MKKLFVAFSRGLLLTLFVALIVFGLEKPADFSSTKQYVRATVMLEEHTSLHVSGYNLESIMISAESNRYFKISNGDEVIEGSIQVDQQGDILYVSGPALWSIERPWRVLAGGTVDLLLVSPESLPFYYGVSVEDQYWNLLILRKVVNSSLLGGLFGLVLHVLLNLGKRR